MSSLKYTTVIVFGPTGEVGGAAALEAAKRGAKVFLAMRDPSKSIPGISQQDEKSLSFERIKADLTDPSSVTAAIHKSGAKAAYIYRVFSQDHLSSTLTAMKEAGIEYIVFLSSFSLEQGLNIREIQPTDFIAFIHAQIEIKLEDLGIAHTSLRPAQFASNAFKMSLDRSTTPWHANVLYDDYRGDCIVPLDIGRVGGAVLVNPPSGVAATGKEVIFLCGPKVRRNDEAWDVIKKVTGKEIDVKYCTEQEFGEFLKSKGLPPPVIDNLLRGTKDFRTRNIYSEPFYSESVANIKKYSGHEPTQFEDYIGSYDLEGASLSVGG